MGSGRSNRGGSPTRRAVLLAAGAAVAGAADVVPSGAFTRGTLGRPEDVDVVRDLDGVVALDVQDPVERNTRMLLVDVTNNHSKDLSVTVSLTNCGDGTLYDEEGDSGCTVTQTIASGNSRGFEIDAAANGIVDWTLTATATGFFAETPRSVESTNNVQTAIVIKNFNLGNANAVTDTIKVNKAKAVDDDGDDDLVRTEYTVRDPDGDEVGTLTHDYTARAQYDRQNFDIDATMSPGVTYTVVMEVFDADGNKAQTSATVTA